MEKLDQLSIGVRTVVEILVLPILGFGVVKLDKMADNVHELNLKMAIVIAERQIDKESMKDLEVRIRALESRGK